MGLGQMPKSQAVVAARGHSIPAWAKKALPSLSASAREMHGPWDGSGRPHLGVVHSRPSTSSYLPHTHIAPDPFTDPALAQELLDENQKEVQGTKGTVSPTPHPPPPTPCPCAELRPAPSAAPPLLVGMTRVSGCPERSSQTGPVLAE